MCPFCYIGKREFENALAQFPQKDEAYNLDKAVVANSFDAHRFSHLAKQHNLQDEAEERLFYAYFTEGLNTGDHDTLIRLGTDIGLEADEVKRMLESNQFADDVKHDIYEAQQVGVRGVSYFVLGENTLF